MRKHSRRTVRRALCPTMVALSVVPEFGLSENIALTALCEGWAGIEQFNTLLDCTDLLLLAAEHSGDQGAVEVSMCARGSLRSIAERRKSAGKIGASGDEIKTLRCVVDVSEDFWKRKSGALFSDARQALDKFRIEQAQKVAA